MEDLENLAVDNEEVMELYVCEQGAVVIDAMAVVQQLGSSDPSSCKIIADNINQWLYKFVQSHQSVHMVFDHHDVHMSLKQQTRERRMARTKASIGKSHICRDATPIRTTFKQFVASIKIKDSLTDYLANNILDHYQSHETEVIVSTQRGTQEEADTLLILHALHAVRTCSDVQIISLDTDVLLLAMRRYPQL